MRDPRIKRAYSGAIVVWGDDKEVDVVYGVDDSTPTDEVIRQGVLVRLDRELREEKITLLCEQSPWPCWVNAYQSDYPLRKVDAENASITQLFVYLLRVVWWRVWRSWRANVE